MTRYVLLMLTALTLLPLTGATQTLPLVDYVVLDVHLPDSQGTFGRVLLTDATDTGLFVGTFPQPLGDEPPQPTSILLSLTNGHPQIRTVQCHPDATWTHAQGINRHPAVVGTCVRGDTTTGFYRSESGRITVLLPPGAETSAATGVNNSHQTVGLFRTAGSVRTQGFLWDRGRNRFTLLAAPFPEAVSTLPLAINNHGAIIGVYVTELPTTHGFLLKNGVWTRLDAPLAEDTILNDINDAEQIVGTAFSRGAGGTYPFLLEDGVFRRLLLPARAFTEFVEVLSINNRGQLLGVYRRFVAAGEPEVVLDERTAFLATPLAETPRRRADTFALVAQRQAATVTDPTPGLRLWLEGCAGDPVPAGHVRPTKLALSGLFCTP